MKRSYGWLVALSAMTASLMACADQSNEPTALAKASRSVAPGAVERYVVQFDKDALPNSFAATVSALGGRIEQNYGRIGGAVVTGLSADAAAQLASTTGIVTVEHEQFYRLDAMNGVNVASANNTIASSANPTAAIIFARQWNMRQIHADNAWAQGALGSPAVKVAILDTGIDPSNPDLAGKVDFANSTSFVPEDEIYLNWFWPGRPAWIDMHYHGTHVAATVSSNAVIAAGVTSNVTLMAVKVMSVEGWGSGVGVLNGIMWATDHGADVINMSLGGDFLKAELPGLVSLINRAVNYANSKGVTIVAAAGNDARDLDHNGNSYLAYCDAPNVLCVAATGPPDEETTVYGPWTDLDASAYYTNYGRSAISVSAPGGNGVTGVSAVCSRYSILWTICGTGNYVLNSKGTSMAAAHVTGLAALLVEKNGRNPGKVRTLIQRGAIDLGPRGADARYGKGRIDVMNSLAL